MESAASQPYIFLITIYGGMVAGALYDVFRRIRRTLKCGRWSSALLDTLFIIVLGVIVAFVLYTANMASSGCIPLWDSPWGSHCTLQGWLRLFRISWNGERQKNQNQTKKRKNKKELGPAASNIFV